MKTWLIFSMIVFSGFQLANASVPGDEPVEFSLPRLSGEPLTLSALRGQWVILNYWATWCGPCRKEIPELSELHDQRQDITVLGLAYEEATVEEFTAFLDEFEATYPILLVDVYAPPEPFGAPRVLPTTIILDPNGVVVKNYAGPVTKTLLEAFIDNFSEP
jgi:thiol-disulfide isomerase/thioredoxin